MSAALITGIVISIAGLAASAAYGLTALTEQEFLHHISLAIYSGLINLLSHSMMMFYLIGKGRAVRDAMTEGGLSGDQDRLIARARGPVFLWGTGAMGATIVAGLLGASADTRALPAPVHAWFGYTAILVNLMALAREIQAVTISARVVDEVDRLLAASQGSARFLTPRSS